MNQIIKAVLPQLAGDYLQGVDFNSIKSSFSGEISMENIALNPTLLQKHGIPFNVTYSNIKKLEAKVPWLKAKSEPSVVKITDMCLLMTLAEPNKVDPLTQRTNFLDEITKQCYAKVKALDGKDNSGGPFAGMKVAIVDNLQISIQNLHIRIEDTEKRNSFGFTLKEMSFYTANDKWEKSFYDRTLEANKNKDLYKKCEIKDFGFYFRINEIDKHFISSSNFSDAYRRSFMEHYIEEIHTVPDNKEKISIIDTIFKISYDLKITLRTKASSDTDPKVAIGMVLHPNQATLEHRQLEELLGFLERVTQMKKKAKFSPIPLADEKEQKQKNEEFRILVRSLVTAKEGQEINWVAEFDPKVEDQERKLLKELLIYIPDSVVVETLHEIIFTKEKSKIIEHLKRKGSGETKPAGGLLSMFSMPKKPTMEAPEVGAKEVEEFIMNMIKKSEEEFKQGSEGFLVRLNIAIENWSFFLVNYKSDHTVNGIWATLEDFKISFEQKNLSGKASSELQVSLFNSEILLKSQYPGQDMFKEFCILRKVGPQSKSTNLIDFTFRHDVLQGKDYISIAARLGEAEFHYMTAFVYNLLKFTKIEEDVEEINTIAVETIDDLKANAQQNIEEYLRKKPEITLKIGLASSKIVVPLNQNGDINSDCWVVNLGNCHVTTVPKEEDDLLYKTIAAELKEFKVLYFTSKKNYYTWITAPDDDMRNSAEFVEQPETLIGDSSVKMKIMSFDSVLSDNQTHEQTKVYCNFEAINISSNLMLLEKLISLPEYTDYTRESDFHELLEIDKRNIMRSNPETFKVTLGKEMSDHYIALFYQNYLYLYKDAMDLTPAKVIKLREPAIRIDIRENYFTAWIKDENKSYYISCADQKAFGDFMDLLQRRAASHAVAEEPKRESLTKKKSVERKMTEDQIDSQRKSHRPLSMMEDKFLNKPLFSLKLVVQKVKFFLQSNRSGFTFELSDFALDMLTKTYTKEMAFGIGSVGIIAARGDVHKELISSKPRKLVIPEFNPEALQRTKSAGSNRLVRIQYIEYEDKHPTYRAERCKADLDVVFNTLQIFWKPLYINELVYTLKLIANKASSHAQEEAESQAYSSRKKSSLSYEKLRQEIRHKRRNANSFRRNELRLLKASIKIQELSCSLFIPKLDIEMARISLVQMNANYIVQEQNYIIEGNLKNLQIVDLTNYPFTIKKKRDFVQPIEIFGVDKDVESLLEFSMMSLYDKHPDIQKNTYSYLRVVMNSVTLNFVTQPVLRIVDFLLSYVANIPLPAEVGQISIVQYENALKLIQRPKFMSIKVEINHPKICLRHLPKAPNYIILDLGNIDVYNEIKENSNRLYDHTTRVEKLYTEKYNVAFKSIHMYRVNASGEQQALSDHCDLTVEYLACKYSEEMKLIMNHDLKKPKGYQPFKNDRTVDVHIKSLDIKLSRDDYMEILDCLAHNVLNDDGEDFRYSYDPKILIEDAPFLVQSEKEYTPAPMIITLKLSSLVLVLWDEVRELPLTLVEASDIVINLSKDEHKSSKTVIDFEDITGYRYERNESNEVLETPILSVTRHMKNLVLLRRHKSVHINLNNQSIEDLDLQLTHSHSRDPSENTQKNFRITITKKLNGDKLTEIEISEVKFILNVEDLLRLSEFASYTPEELYRKAIKKEEEEQVVVQRAACSETRATIHRAFICLPSAGKSCPILKGSIMFNYIQFDTLQLIKETLVKKQFIDHNSIGIVLQNNELLVCDFEDFTMKKDVSLVKKRSIVHPFSLTFNSKESLCSAEGGERVMVRRERNSHVDKIIVRIACKDLVLMVRCMEYLQQRMALYEKWQRFPTRESKLKNLAERQNEEANLAVAVRNFDIFQEELKFINGGFQLRFINEAKQYSVPLLDISLLGAEGNPFLRLFRTGSSTEIGGDMMFSSYYYNSKASLWEPLLEKFGIHYRLDYSPIDDPQLTMNLSVKQSININISSEMVDNFLTTFYEWKNKFEGSQNKHKLFKSRDPVYMSMRKKKKTEIEQKHMYGNDNIEYVSPYSVLNLSGYEIDVISSSESKYELHLCEDQKNDILFETNMEEIFSNMESADLFSYRSLYIRLHHPELGILKSQNLVIDDLGTKLVQYEDCEALSELPSNARLICNISIEGKKKLITFGSSLLFKNHLYLTLIVRLKNDKGEKIERVIETGGFNSLPFDVKQGEIVVLLRNHLGDETNPIVLKIQDLLRCNNTEICFSGHNCLIRIEKKLLYLVVHFEPFAVIRNCLPLELEFELSDKKTGELVTRTGKLQPQEEFQVTSMLAKDSLFLSIRIEDFAWSPKTLLSPTKELVDGIKLNHKDGAIKLMLHKRTDESYTQEFVIYAAICILNETNLPISISSSDKLLPGHNRDRSFKLLFLEKECKMRVNAVVGSQLINSSELNTRVVGDFPVDLKCNGPERMNLGASISSEMCDSKNKLFSKMIVISPRYVILNETDQNLLFCQSGTKDIFMVPSKHRTTVHFQGAAKEKLLNFTRESQEEGEWQWSGSVDCAASGEFFPIVENKKRDTVIYYKLAISNYGPVVYVTVTEQVQKEAAYLIHNLMENVDMMVYQEGCTDCSYFAGPGQVLPFGWKEPHKNQELVVTLLKGNEHIATSKCRFDRIGETNVILENHSTNDGGKISAYSEVILEGTSRKLRIFDQKPDSKQKALSFHFYFKFANLGVSLVAEKKELIYLTLNPAFLAVKSDGNILATQFRVKLLEIDNNLSRTTPFPVMLYPKHLSRLEDSRYYNLDIITQSRIKQGSSDITYFDRISVILNETFIKIDGNLFESIFVWAMNISDVANKLSPEITHPAQILFLSSKAKMENPTYTEGFFWQKHMPANLLSGYVFVRSLTLYPIFINLTYHHIKSSKGSHILISYLKSLFGSALANFDDAPLTLVGVQLDGVFDSWSGIIRKLTNRYSSKLTEAVLGIALSSNIIGNPIKFFGGIANGVTDLFEKPIEGFREGPLEGGLGIIEGVGSLASKTVGGAFNSVHNITGSLANGISQLAADEEYNNERQRENTKANTNIFSGLYQGVKSLGKGTLDGITGVVKKPAQAVSKEGVGGFFKGTLQGVTGLFVKPITGGLDAVSKVSEGVSNTFDNKRHVTKTEKYRLSRVFYGKEGIIKHYLEYDALALDIITKYKKEKYLGTNLDWMEGFHLHYSYPEIHKNKTEEKHVHLYLTLTMSRLFLVDFLTNTITWKIKLNYIDQISDEKEKEILFLLRKKPKMLKSKTVSLAIPQPELKKKVVFKLKKLLELFAESSSRFEQGMTKV